MRLGLTYLNFFYIFFIVFLTFSSVYQPPLHVSGLVEPKYEFLSKWGIYGSGNGQFKYPHGVALDSSSNVYVADWSNHRIQKFTSDGKFITMWGSQGTGEGQFNYPHGVAVDSSGNIYVTDWSNHRIQKFTSDGKFITMWGSQGTGEGQFNYPHGVAVDSSGNVYVTEVYNHRIQKFTSDGEFITMWGSQGTGDGQFNYPRGIAVDSTGIVYVVDTNNHRIQKFTSTGIFISKWGSQGTGEGQFNSTRGLALDSSGNVYVVDPSSFRIQKFTSDGEFISMWGSYGSRDGQFNDPCSVAVDASGSVYIADVNNNRIQKFALPTLTVTAPNGDENWTRDSVHMLTWKSTGNPGANVKIELLKEDVVNLVISTSTANDGSYLWTIPADQPLGADYKISVTSTTYPTITDSSNVNSAITMRIYAVIIDKITVSSQRCDVGSIQHVKVHARWDNDSNVSEGAITLSDKNYLTNADGWADISVKSLNVEKQVFRVTAVNCSGVTEFSQIPVSPSIIWDRVNVTLSISDDRIDVGSNADVKWTAKYEYDESPFQGKITTSLNEKTNAPNQVGKAAYIVDSAEDTKYGLSVFKYNSVECVWDRVKITQGGVSNPLTKTGSIENVWFKAIYEYDGKEFNGEPSGNGGLNKISVNGIPLLWSSIDKVWKYSTKLDDNGKLTFEVTSVGDMQYKLTKFVDAAGPQSITWEKPFFETTVGIVLVATVTIIIVVGVIFVLRNRR